MGVALESFDQDDNPLGYWLIAQTLDSETARARTEALCQFVDALMKLDPRQIREG